MNWLLNHLGTTLPALITGAVAIMIAITNSRRSEFRLRKELELKQRQLEDDYRIENTLEGAVHLLLNKGVVKLLQQVAGSKAFGWP